MSRAGDDMAALLAAARSELGPTPEEVERVKTKLLTATVGVAAATGALAAGGSAAPAATGAAGAGAAAGAGMGVGVATSVGGSALALKLGVLALALGSVVGGAVYVGRGSHARPPAAVSGSRTEPGTQMASMTRPGTATASGTATAPGTGTPTVTASGTASGSASISALPATGPGTVGAVLPSTIRSESVSAPRPRPPAQAPRSAIAEVAPSAPAAVTPAPPAESAPAETAPPVTLSAADRYERENAMMGDAWSAYRTGGTSATLTALQAYEKAFPDGQLAQSAASLRIMVQCRIGNRAVAATQRAALLARWPDADIGPIDAVCGAQPP